MKGIDEGVIKEKYKDVTNAIYPVVGGGDVVGQEVDGDNRLVYVVRKDNNLFLSYAEHTDIIPVIYMSGGTTVVVTTKQKP